MNARFGYVSVLWCWTEASRSTQHSVNQDMAAKIVQARTVFAREGEKLPAHTRAEPYAGVWIPEPRVANHVGHEPGAGRPIPTAALPFANGKHRFFFSNAPCGGARSTTPAMIRDATTIVRGPAR
jgi:hypothetical protein